MAKEVTLDSAIKEGKHSGLNALGVIGGAILMKIASAYVNPWVVPAVGLVAGYAARVYGEDEVREIGSGLMAAGTIVLTKKGLDFAATKVPALAKLSENIPSLAGPGKYTFDASALRGGFAEAKVVSSRLLR